MNHCGGLHRVLAGAAAAGVVSDQHYQQLGHDMHIQLQQATSDLLAGQLSAVEASARAEYDPRFVMKDFLGLDKETRPPCLCNEQIYVPKTTVR